MLEEVVILPEQKPELVRQDGNIIDAPVSDFDKFRLISNTNEVGIPWDWVELMKKLDEGLYDGYLEDVFDFYENLHGDHFDSYTNFQLACSHFTTAELGLKSSQINRLMRKVKRMLLNQNKTDREIMQMLKKA